jgi:peptidoglycan hydrolase-like protein with peptidoglycan-binding domain
MVTLKKGSKNEYVKALQYILEIDADGIFGKNTEQAIRAYQKSKELIADGIVGKNTYAAIVKDAPTLKVGSSGKWVNVLECLL